MSFIDKFAIFIGVTGVISVVLSVCFWEPAPAKVGADQPAFAAKHPAGV